MATSRWTLACLASLLLAASGCGSDGEAADPNQFIVKITDSGYEPARIVVPTGTRVTWVNDGERPNSVQTWQSGPHPFDLHTFYADDRKSFVFRYPGRYEYFSSWRSGYDGVVRVIRRD
jgi:plastocyanin